MVEAPEMAEGMEVVEEGEGSSTAQMEKLEEVREAEERKTYYQEKLKQINLRIRQETRLL